SSLLLLIIVANENSTAVSTKPYALLFLGCVLVTPSVLSLIKSLWKIIFKDSKMPRMPTVVFTEFFVALGTAVLTIVAMPKFDILTNVMMLNSVAILSAVLQVAGNIVMKERIRFITTSIFAVIFITLGYSLFVAGYCVEAAKYGSIPITPVGLAIAGTLCVSLNWWENYSMLFKSHFLQSVSEDIKRSRNIVCIVSSFVRIGVIASVLGAYVILSGQQWSSVLSVSQQTKTVVLSLFAVQVISTSLCHWFALVACKMHAVRRSFVIPMWMVSPAVLVGFLITFISHFQSFVSSSSTAGRSVTAYCETMVKTSTSQLDAYSQLIMDARRTLCSRSSFMEGNILVQGLLGSSLACWWIGLVLCTIYTCFLKVHRIERTRDLFVRRHYEAAFIDQSMLLNMRFEIHFCNRTHSDYETMTVFLCATMWHETYAEMMKIILSLFRLDSFRPRRNPYNDVSFEFHIYFDDAFQDVEKRKGRHVNEYAETLLVVIKEVYMLNSGVFKKMTRVPSQEIIQTPYGGRLRYTLPHGNILNVHLKDKNLIRNKKRWSQIMYLYYLLGWKLKHKYFLRYKHGQKKATLEKNLMVILSLCSYKKRNMCILALDGDVDFQPSAVMLLIDRLRLYPEVGAVCGRIHPTGTGPMVWYQKFEYAVGHWLQKSAEHVFGSVLCSPGCFSLFRAEALMGDNVMKKYATKATEAAHYIQYDQGEDRWLCTLLLQQGWRVEYNAASNSYTNAPQDFKEFYNQRRRWGPSTMANTLDLLGTGSLTSQRNKSISKPYMIYQTISMAGSILGPATICLMIAGSFSFVFDVTPSTSLALASLPPAIYLVLCYNLKIDTQITVAAVMSILYAFLMTATILSVIGEMVVNDTFTPSGLFFISIVLIYVTTALLHPQEFHLIIYGIVYVLSIPSGYLLLTIYSIVNMNNVSWGTRETAKSIFSDTSTNDRKYEWNCRCCSWNVRIQMDNDDTVTMNPQGHHIIPSETQPSEKRLPIQDGWDLQERYLKPMSEDNKEKEKIAADLKDLRNNVTIVFFMFNALWLGATFFLQAIGQSVSIPIPKLKTEGHVEPGQYIYIDPIQLMFLLGFSFLLLIQFVAMLWHRLQTFIHYVSYHETEAKAATKACSESMEELMKENRVNCFLVYRFCLPVLSRLS
uniref:chitin synthase n=1 Tax=Scleropages formosus TaxID=113540 RepID=A0A8C9RS57_SCLFO